MFSVIVTVLALPTTLRCGGNITRWTVEGLTPRTVGKINTWRSLIVLWTSFMCWGVLFMASFMLRTLERDSGGIYAIDELSVLYIAFLDDLSVAGITQQ